MQFAYEAILEDAGDGVYTVELPEFGSVTEGMGFEEALKMGADLLELEVTCTLADDNDLPKPVFGRKLTEGQERVLLSVNTSKEEADSMWPWVTTTQAAAMLNVTQSRVRNLVRSGMLGATKSGRDLWVSRADVIARAKTEQRAGRPRKKLATVQ